MPLGPHGSLIAPTRPPYTFGFIGGTTTTAAAIGGTVDDASDGRDLQHEVGPHPSCVVCPERLFGRGRSEDLAPDT
jgi:hypothetical protein